MMSPAVRTAGNVSEKDFRTLSEWNVNLLRRQFVLSYKLRPGCDDAGYAKWVESQYPVLDRVFELAEKYGIWIVVDLHLPPSFRLQTRDEREKLHEIWRKPAGHCKGEPMLRGCDLLNEPSVTDAAPELEPIAELYDSLIRAIRTVDPTTPVIVAPDGGGSLDLPVYPYDNVIYTIHFYRPNLLTRRLDRNQRPHPGYPDPEKGWDRAYLRRQLEKTRRFQQATGARIYVGEFSIIRWAPGAKRICATRFPSLRNTAGSGAVTPSANGTAGVSNTATTRPPPSPRKTDAGAQSSKR